MEKQQISAKNGMTQARENFAKREKLFFQPAQKIKTTQPPVQAAPLGERGN
jgi:hypothetical protein